MEQYKVFTKKIFDGIQHVYKFPNGFGASIVRHSFSYGGNIGLYELAVLDKNDNLTYETEITDDVIGYLTEEQYNLILKKIQLLNPDGKLPLNFSTPTPTLTPTPKPKFYIFLDIDGVLNNANYINYMHFVGVTRKTDTLDERNVQALNKLIDELKKSYEVEIVISSTWRLDMRYTIDTLRDSGVLYDKKYHNITIDLETERGVLIKQFLRAAEPYKGYVVIDDDSFDIKEYIPPKNFIHTDYSYGLTFINVNKFLRGVENE